MGSDASKTQPTRRSLLALLAGLGSAAIGIALAVPGAAYVVDPLLRGGARKGRWLKVASLSGLGEDHPAAFPVVGEQVDSWMRTANVRLGVVWLRKKGERVHALSAECPHLGCKVAYDRERKRFACPCHESAFSQDGERLGGPAPRSLDALETRIVDDHVEVRFLRYRSQVKERVEVG